MSLRRGMNLFDAVMLVVGNIIGVGIFTTTGIVASYISHPGWLLAAWAVGGVLVLAGALTLGELGASLPHSGGEYVYLREAYHPQLGFVYGWACFWATFSGSIAILGIAFADYMSYFFPVCSLNNIIIRSPVSLSGGQLLAMAVIIGLSLFNYLGIKLGSRLQDILSVLKVVLIAGIIWLGFSSGYGNWGNFSPKGKSMANVSWLAFCQGLIPVWFTYAGWNSITYLGEELKTPARDIPLSSAIGVLITLILYLLINVMYVYAVPLDSLAGVIRVAEISMTYLRGGLAAGLVSLAVALSILGCINSTIIVGARIYYAMARDGLFFSHLSRVHPRFGSPGRAVLVQGGWACILLLSGTFAKLLSFVVFVMLIFAALSGFGLFRLRKYRPDLPRPYRVWGYPITPAVFTVSCLGIAFFSLIREPVQAALGIALILSGVPAYWFWQRLTYPKSPPTK
jgi:APA family basic amino acid/polyamine antiporter